MTIQQFSAGQTLTAAQMNTLQESDFNYTINTQSSNSYTLVASDLGKLIRFTAGGSITLTVPTDSSVSYDVGDSVSLLLDSVGTLTVAGAAGVTVVAEGNILQLTSRYSVATLIKMANNSWMLTGVLMNTIEDGEVTSAKIADGTIVNADINASAAIALSKLANVTAGQVLLGTTTTGVVTATTISGDVTVTGAGVTAISSGVIVNADVNASADISLSKLATGTVASVVIHNASGVPTATALSGDVTVNSTGVTAIGSGVIVNDDIDASAAIADTKLATISTAGKVSNSATTADSANTVSAIVARDASGNFVAGKATLATADVTTVVETANIVASAATGTINIDFSTNPTVYYTSNATANWTLNVRGTSGVTLNNTLTTGQIATVTFLATNGATPYRPTVFQVDGSAVTPKFMGGTAPSAGNANSIDAYTLAIIKTGNAEFTVLASQTRLA